MIHNSELKTKEKKRKEEEKDQLKKLKELIKNQNARKRKLDDSSSDSEIDIPNLDDSDNDFEEACVCPGCKTDDGGQDEWISCTSCKLAWHISCTGDAILLEIPLEQMKEYPFVCEYCIAK